MNPEKVQAHSPARYLERIILEIIDPEAARERRAGKQGVEFSNKRERDKGNMYSLHLGTSISYIHLLIQ